MPNPLVYKIRYKTIQIFNEGMKQFTFLQKLYKTKSISNKMIFICILKLSLIFPYLPQTMSYQFEA